MPDPDVARSQRQAAIDSRIRKKKTDAEAAKKARAAKKRKTHKTHTITSAAPQSIPDIFDEPTTGASDAPNINRQRQKRKRTEDAGGNKESDEDDSEQPSCLHPDDPANFLMLSKALRILLAWELTEEQIDEADKLLREYCSDLVDVSVSRDCGYVSLLMFILSWPSQLYGTDMIRPNHHYATHTPRSVRDYGPLHEFWTFLFERLNKVLKSYKTNNRSGGELEVTFFREFHRTVLSSRLVGCGFYRLAQDIDVIAILNPGCECRTFGSTRHLSSGRFVHVQS
jgi:hypothetical protein